MTSGRADPGFAVEILIEERINYNVEMHPCLIDLEIEMLFGMEYLKNCPECLRACTKTRRGNVSIGINI